MNLFFSRKLMCQNSKIYVLIFTCCLASYIVAECFFRDSFEDYSDRLVVIDQKSYHETWKKFLSFMTNLGYGLAISIIIIFYYEVSKNKINAIFLIFLSTFVNYFLSIIKMLYHQPRPYMRNSDIIPIFKCGEEWGNPSGHAMNGFVVYFIVLNSLRKRLLTLKFNEENSENDIGLSPGNNTKALNDIEMKDIVKSKETIGNECDHKNQICPKCKINLIKKNQDEEISLCEPCINNGSEKQLKKKISRKNDQKLFESSVSLKMKAFYFSSNIFCYSLSFSIIALVGYSRYFFGLHSFNQILLGWVYGIGFTVYFYYILNSKDLIVDRLILFFDKISKYSKIKFRINCSICLTFFLIVTFLVPWIIFYVYDKRDDIDQTYIDNMINKCGIDYINNNLLFYKNCFGDVGTISIVFGIMYGVLLSSGNYSHEEFWPNYWMLPKWKKALRMIFLGAIAGIIYGIFSAIKFKVDTYVACFLNNGLKGILLGFFIVILLPKIYVKLHLDVKGDFMREKEA